MVIFLKQAFQVIWMEGREVRGVEVGRLGEDAAVNLGDTLYLLNFLFLNGPPPSAGLDCRRIEGCDNACF